MIKIYQVYDLELYGQAVKTRTQQPLLKGLSSQKFDTTFFILKHSCWCTEFDGFSIYYNFLQFLSYEVLKSSPFREKNEKRRKFNTMTSKYLTLVFRESSENFVSSLCSPYIKNIAVKYCDALKMSTARSKAELRI